MPVRFRRTLKIAPGLRLNLGKRGVSASVGVKGLRRTYGASGVRTTVGLPGTGLSYTTTAKPRRKDAPARPPEMTDGQAWLFLLLTVAFLAGLAWLL